VLTQQYAEIADTLQLRDIAMANIFWLSIFAVHPVSTTEPSVCGSDVALCQFTLTTYLCADDAKIYKVITQITHQLDLQAIMNAVKTWSNQWLLH